MRINKWRGNVQSNVYFRGVSERVKVLRLILLTDQLIGEQMRGVVLTFGLFAITFISCALGRVGAQEDPAANPEFYTAKVKPIFVANCASCHMGTNHRGGLNMNSREGLLKGGRDGAVLVPGDPANSLLVKLIRHEGPADDPMPMPPRKPKISDADVAIITQWVKAGAVMPASPGPNAR